MLPNEIIAQLNTEFQCRENQIRQLAALYAVCMRIAEQRPPNNRRRISHHHRFFMYTASQQLAKPRFFNRTSTSWEFRTS
jgi:hypothetical protein